MPGVEHQALHKAVKAIKIVITQPVVREPEHQEHVAEMEQANGPANGR